MLELALRWLEEHPDNHESPADSIAAEAAIRCAEMRINCDPDDWPQSWYRRFGFTDEVYWRRTYTVTPAA